VARSRIEDDVSKHDLLIDDVPVKTGISDQELIQYCLQEMADEDRYVEEHMDEPITGKQYRANDARIKDSFKS
jgi:hypothetical protein